MVSASIGTASEPRGHHVKIIVQQVWKNLTAAEVQFNVTADFFQSPKVREPLWCDYMASCGVTLSSLSFLCLLFKLFFWVIHNCVIISTETFTLLSFSTSVFDVFRAEKTQFSPLCFDTHRLHNAHSVRVTHYSSEKRPRSKSFSFISWVFQCDAIFTRAAHSRTTMAVLWGKKVYSVANLKPVCNCNGDPVETLASKCADFYLFLRVSLLNSQPFLWNLCLFVCFQGGYAAYRYAQPTAATAAAYSDRYDSKDFNPSLFPLFTQPLSLFFSVLLLQNRNIITLSKQPDLNTALKIKLWATSRCLQTWWDESVLSLKEKEKEKKKERVAMQQEPQPV